MIEWSVYPVVILAAVYYVIARPNEYTSTNLLGSSDNGDFMNGGPIEYKPNEDVDPALVNNGGLVGSKEYVNLLDTDHWKELLAQGKVRDMINSIQRAFGSDRPVKMRTQWGGPGTSDIGNTVRNTVNWNAYKGDKTNLNVIMDSQFSRHNGKVDMINPSVGINFQLKY